MAKATKIGLKVVARLRNGRIIKGFLDEPPAPDFEALFQETPYSLPNEISLRTADSSGDLSSPLPLPLESLKALFFVRTFEGSKEYKEVKFFEKHPPIKGLWVRIRFFDNEFLEGVVRNSLQYVAESGFFLKPPDLQSNNEILYVVKNSLTDFRVLGVSPDY